MGQAIWEILELYRGMWIAVDAEGIVLDASEDLAALRGRSPRARTYVFACGEPTVRS